ncbi:hypothetical protein L1987_55696 [Smallanthus sonchifolius]|uniref:Uncharacterized protein n=1 Tax=Smallanthus sonchifolius TaxID=185202 RepID=A0ACB9EAQ7_9ASTR|nr:hypothetical protein L1987_55696 [Smallanthus sonchifolius]
MSGLINVERKTASTGDNGAHINLKVQGQNGSEFWFRIKRSTKMKNLMFGYYFRQPAGRYFISYWFDGLVLQGHETPDEVLSHSHKQNIKVEGCGGMKYVGTPLSRNVMGAWCLVFDGCRIHGYQTPHEVLSLPVHWQQ